MVSRVSMSNNSGTAEDVRDVSDGRGVVQPQMTRPLEPHHESRRGVKYETTSDGDVVVVEPSFDTDDGNESDSKGGMKTQSSSQPNNGGDWQSRSPMGDDKSRAPEKRSAISPNEPRHHTRNLSAHFYDATRLSGDNTKQELLPVSPAVGKKHRRIFSGDVTNPNLAHRRINSIGNAAAVNRFVGGKQHQRDNSAGLDILSAAVDAAKEELAAAGGDGSSAPSSRVLWEPSSHQGYRPTNPAVSYNYPPSGTMSAPPSRMYQPPQPQGYIHGTSIPSVYHQPPYPPPSFYPPPPGHATHAVPPAASMCYPVQYSQSHDVYAKPQAPPPPQTAAYPPPPQTAAYPPPQTTTYPQPTQTTTYPPPSQTTTYPPPPPSGDTASRQSNSTSPLGDERVRSDERSHNKKKSSAVAGAPSVPAQHSQWSGSGGTNQGVQTFVTAISVGDGNKTIHPTGTHTRNASTNTESSETASTAHHRKLSSFSSILMGSSLFSPDVNGGEHPLKAKAHHRQNSSSVSFAHHRATSSTVSFLQGLDLGEDNTDAAFLRNLHDSAPNYGGPRPPPGTGASSPPPPPPLPPSDSDQPQQSTENDNGGTKLAKGGTSKRVRRKCTVANCENRVVQGGLCIAHGAKRKTCKHPGCDKNVKKAGLCSTHGPARKRCDVGNCNKVAVQGGRCIAHGAKKKLCSIEDCKKQAILTGMCKKHHDKVNGITGRNKSQQQQQQPISASASTEDSSTSRRQSHKPTHTRGLSIFQDLSADAVHNLLSADDSVGQIVDSVSESNNADNAGRHRSGRSGSGNYVYM